MRAPQRPRALIRWRETPPNPHHAACSFPTHTKTARIWRAGWPPISPGEATIPGGTRTGFSLAQAGATRSNQKDADRPIHLETKQYIPFDSPASYRASLDKLLSAIAAGDTAALPQKYRTPYVTAPPLPLHFVPRPAELQSLLETLVNDASERRIALTAVRAMGGIGKTVLAQALCHHPAVQDAFPDGVLWAVIGQNPTELHLTTQMREFAKGLGDDLTRYDTLQGSSNQLRNTLQDKAALLVLDDVWNPRDVHPFIADAPRSRLLLTTRQQAANLPGLHQRLLEAYRARCAAGWPSGPDDGYFFTWLAYHLWEAGERAELRRLLLDPGWMRAKLTKKDSAALRADYTYPENRGLASASQAWFARGRRCLSPIFIPAAETQPHGPAVPEWPRATPRRSRGF